MPTKVTFQVSYDSESDDVGRATAEALVKLKEDVEEMMDGDEEPDNYFSIITEHFEDA